MSSKQSYNFGKKRLNRMIGDLWCTHFVIYKYNICKKVKNKGLVLLQLQLLWSIEAKVEAEYYHQAAVAESDTFVHPKLLLKTLFRAMKQHKLSCCASENKLITSRHLTVWPLLSLFT